MTKIASTYDKDLNPERTVGQFPGRPSAIQFSRLLNQLSVCAAVTLFSLPVWSATFRFSSTSNRIYVEGGGSATLSDIKTALPNAPLDQVDSVNKVWLARANLWITDGSSLVIHGTGIGGDANEFRLQSNNSSDPGSFVSVTADWGALDIKGTKIISWDSAAGGPDTEFQTYGRAFVRVRSRLDTNGVTALESRMDIVDSDISYLGYDASESYGLTWKVGGVHPDPSKSIFDYVNVYGDIINSRIHDSFWAVYTYGAYGSQWLNNEIDHNAGYGFDPHDDSDNLRIEGNNVHHNGWIGRGHHGIIASRRCDHLTIRNNHSWANGGNGIMLHRHASDNLVENNRSELNGDSGIAIFDADRNQIRNNVVLSNSNAGMRFSVGASDNFIEQNEVGYSGRNGFYLYQGDDLAEPDDSDPTVTARPQRNTFTNNRVHHSVAEAINLGNGDDNVFMSNTFSADNGSGLSAVDPNSVVLRFENAINTVLAGNSLPANAVVRLDGASTNSTTMELKNQPLVHLMLDAFSTATFEDDSGAIFDLDQGDLATTVDSSRSSLSVTLAALGSSTSADVTVVTRKFLVVPDSGVVQINPTLWESSGDFKKQWTTQPVDSTSGPTPQAISPTANIHYTVGDLSPNTSYLVLKNNSPLSPITSDSIGQASFSDVPGTTSPVQYAIVPNTQGPPTVSVAATDANAAETGPDSGTFTVSRTGDTTTALTVNYSVSGSAVNGTDYQSLSGTVSIAAGAASAIVTVTPINDTTVESNETVILTLAANAAYTVGSPNSATVTITDNDQPPTLPTVTVAATDANAAEAGPDSGTFTVSRTGDTTTALTVNYSVSGSAVNGTDYQSLSGTMSIPAGAASAIVTVTPINDTTVESNETVILTLAANAAYTVGSPNSATVTITDNDQPPTLPTVTVAATDANAAEAGPDPGTFTVSRTGDTTTALTVNYSVSGSAVNGTDYQSLSGTMSIPAGSAYAIVTVTPINDTTVESNETVILTLAASAAYTVGSPNSATVTIADNDQQPTLPTVTVAATDANAAETGPDPGRFTVSRTGDTTTALTVNYSVSGSAVNGTDYQSLSGTVSIAAGAASAIVTVTPINDTTVESNETVILTLAGNAAYTVGSPNSATVTIADNDQQPTPPTVTVAATDANAAEAGADPGRFTVSRTGDTTTALTVNYSVSGSAVNGTDYQFLSGSVSIAAGAASAIVTVTPVNDTTVESNETVILTLGANAAYTVGSPNSATVTIADNDQSPTLPTVTVAATDANAAEAGADPGRFTVSRTGDTTTALTVNYSVSGSAVNGTDYQFLSGSVSIAAGAASAIVTVTPVNDTTVESNETVILTLGANAAYTVGSPNSATVTIADNDQQPTLPTVTVAATDANAAEAGADPGRFTVSRTGDTTTALTVNYSVSGSAVNGTDYQFLSGSVSIAAGAASAIVTVTPVNDTTVESNETVILTLGANAAYTVGSPNSATVTIADNDQSPTLPTVTVAATDANAAEAGADPGRFTVSRTGDTTTTLTVNYSVSGSAVNGTDYQFLSGTVSIAAGAASAIVTVTPVNDTTVESNETVILTLAASAAYTVGSPNSATVTIADNDQSPTLPTVTVAATDANAAEAGADPGRFTVSRTGDTTTALTVNYSVSGSAVNGTDYQFLSGSVSIAAGAASAIVTVTPVNDTTVESNETVILTLGANAAYTVGSPNSATVTIADNDQSPTLPTVTVAATDANAAEAGADPGRFTVSRTGDTTTALTVNYSVSGSAVNGTDYQFLSGTVSIAAGAASAIVTVTPVNDTTVESNETVILTLGANAAYTVGSPNSATVTIADNDQSPTLPTVTVAATDANAAETGPDPGRFTVSRTGDTTTALTVNYSVSGSAVNGTDYQSLSGTVSIAAGSASAIVTVTPINDTTVESNETVILTLAANAAYTVGSPNSATVTIADNDQSPTLPTVTVAATDANAAEAGADPGRFTVSRTGDTTTALTVNYSVSGSAVNGTDYQFLSGTVSIAAGAASAIVTVTPVNDTTVESNETVILTLGANAAYTVGSPNSATVTIADNDQQPTLPTVTVAATDANAAEAGADPGRFTVSRTGDTTTALTVNYSVSGSAVNGTDYQSLSGTVSIAAGAASAIVTVTPVNDTTVESNETVILTLAANAAYTVGSPKSATVTIADNDQPPTLPTVTVAATDANAAETGPDPGTFTLSRTGETTTTLTVNYTVAGTAANGTDYQSLSGTVSILAGAASARITVTPINDTTVEGNETVILTLVPNAAYTVGSPDSATVTIADNDQAPPPEKAVISLIASDSLGSEPGTDTATFTVSRTGDLAAALTVRYTLGGTAVNGVDYQTLSGAVTIPIGAASANVVLRPIDDNLIEVAELVTMSLAPDTAYQVGALSIAVVTLADNDLLILEPVTAGSAQ